MADRSPLLVTIFAGALLCAIWLTFARGPWGWPFVILTGLLLAKAVIGKPIGKKLSDAR